MNTLQLLSIMSAAIPVIANFDVVKNAKSAKLKKAAIAALTSQLVELIDSLTPLKITDRKQFAAHVAGLINSLEYE